MKRSIYIMFVCLGALVACGKNSINKTLDHVENIVVRQPDSALILLDSIKYTIKSGEEQARYILFTLYAKDLSGEDISKDSSIIYARDYMKTTINPKYLALSEYYLGRIYQAQGKNEQALQFYLEAKTNAENTDNNNLKGLINSYIGHQYYSQRKYDNAIYNFQSALQYFNEAPKNYKRQIAALNDIANCFFLKKVKDSAMICYTEALQLARTAQDSAAIKHNLGVMYLTLNEPYIAKQQLFQALRLNRDSTLLNLIYMNLSKVYEKEKMTDSAIYFAKSSIGFWEKQNNIYALTMNYKILSRLEEKNGNYHNALDYSQKHLKIYTKIKTESVIDIQEIETKHELEALQGKQQYYIIAIVSVCLALLIFVLFYIMRIRAKHRKLTERNLKILTLENLLAKIQSEMNEKETYAAFELAKVNSNLIEMSEKEKCACNELTNTHQELTEIKDILAKTQSDMNEKEKFMKVYHNILKEFYKKTEQLSSDFNLKKIVGMNEEQVNNIVTHLQSILYQDMTWDTVHDAGKSTFDVIEKQYRDTLTAKEIKIVYLDCMGYTNAMIAKIMGFTPNTIQQHKSNIRNKLNIKGDIGTAIIEKMILRTT